MGHDRDLKDKRIFKADQYLKEKTLAALAGDGAKNISNLDYSNVLLSLEEIIIAMQMPGVLDKGVRFDMSDHVFDPEFSSKIKDLFSERFGAVQKDSALRSLRMVFKENN